MREDASCHAQRAGDGAAGVFKQRPPGASELHIEKSAVEGRIVRNDFGTLDKSQEFVRHIGKERLVREKLGRETVNAIGAPGHRAFGIEIGLKAANGFQFFVELHRDWEQPVHIERFANDPFMQGWASSRYVWTRLDPTAKSLPATFLFPGDIYGAFALKTPLLDRLRYRFGSDIPDDENGYELKTDLHPDRGTATVTLSRARRPLATATLTGLKLSVLPGTQIIDEKIGARPRTPDTRSWGTGSRHPDGRLLWLEHQGQTVLSALDPQPLTGRACTVTLHETIDFIHIDLRREHVRDYLFERSEHDWTALGTWEVTNRFACDPRWSHMNGESFGTAALWSKFALDGDFTI